LRRARNYIEANPQQKRGRASSRHVSGNSRSGRQAAKAPAFRTEAGAAMH
jgi:hypothetical protein